LLRLTNLAIKNRYNLILIIINKFIKYLYIIIYKKKFIVEQLKYILLNLFKKKYIYLFAQLAIKRIAILKKIYNNILKIQKRLIKY